MADYKFNKRYEESKNLSSADKKKIAKWGEKNMKIDAKIMAKKMPSKPKIIILKSGEEWTVGKKSREKKEKPLRSWGDEVPRFSASHPYSKGKKLKPEGAPHPYWSKKKKAQYLKEVHERWNEQ